MKQSKYILNDVNKTLQPSPIYTVESGNLYKGIEVKFQNAPPAEVPVYEVHDHRTLMNVGQPIAFEWKSGGVWRDTGFKAGDFALISVGDANEPRWQKELTYVSVMIEANFMDNLVQENNFRLSEQRGTTDLFLKDLSVRLTKELSLHNLTGRIYGETMAITYAIHLASNYARDHRKIKIPKGKLSSFQLKQAIEQVHTFNNQALSLEALAAQANLSVFHFARLFKNTVGLSPHQFIMGIKIEKAKQMLKIAKLPLTEVAYLLSFNDQAHFIHAFKRATGDTPGEFLRC